MAKYLMLNSKILPTSEPCLHANNRGVKFGDSFTHRLRGNSSKVFLLRRNYDFLIYAMNKLGMQVPPLFKMSIFATDVELLLQKNRIYKGFVAEITIFRNQSNTKIAIDNSVSILITVEKVNPEWYSLNEKGIKVDVFRKFSIPDYIIDNSLNPIYSQEFFIPIKKDKKGTDEWMLTSENKTILRTYDSLIIYVQENKIIIPKIVSLEFLNPFLGFIISVAGDLNYEIYKADIDEKDLFAFDEIFLINPGYGIKWVLAYKDKRYYHRVSQHLTDEINQRLQMYQ